MRARQHSLTAAAAREARECQSARTHCTTLGTGFVSFFIVDEKQFLFTGTELKYRILL